MMTFVYAFRRVRHAFMIMGRGENAEKADPKPNKQANLQKRSIPNPICNNHKKHKWIMLTWFLSLLYGIHNGTQWSLAAPGFQLPQKVKNHSPTPQNKKTHKNNLAYQNLNLIFVHSPPPPTNCHLYFIWWICGLSRLRRNLHKILPLVAMYAKWYGNLSVNWHTVLNRFDDLHGFHTVKNINCRRVVYQT